MTRFARGGRALMLALAAVLCAVSAAEAGYLVAEWQAPVTSVDGTPLTDLAAYRVYAGTAVPACDGTGYQEFAAPSPNPQPGERVSAVLRDLVADQPYFVRVAARDTSGNESPCTDPVSAVARATLRVSAEQDFGTVELGTSAERTFTVENTGAEPVSVLAAVPSSSPFTVVSGQQLTLAPGASQPVVVRFQPRAAGRFDAAVTFASAAEGVSRRIQAAAAGDPDLQMTAVSAPANAAPGATVSVRYTLRNAGAAAGAFRVGVYASATDPTPGAGILIGGLDVPSLAAGATLTQTVGARFPPEALPARYYVSAVADSNNVLTDTNRANNAFTAATPIVVGPDLVVSALTVPVAGVAGATVTVRPTVQNLGSASGAFRVGVFLSSTDPTPGAGTLIGFQDFIGLAAAGSVTPSIVSTVPRGTGGGPSFVSAVADITNNVLEADESNNGRTATTSLTVAVPDLVVSAVTMPAATGAGGTLSVTNTVQNRGATGATAGSFRVGIYLSATDPTPGAGALIGSRTVTTLAAGGISTAATVTHIPATTVAGTYFVSAVADIDQNVSELDETNNGRTATTLVTIAQPDLTVTNVSVPAAAGAGGTLAIPHTVRSAGVGTQTGAFRVGFYLSAGDATPGAGTMIGSRTITNLAGGAVSAATTSVTIPWTTAAGPYFVSAVADVDGTVFESNEGNNGMTAPAPVTVGAPRLLVTAVTAPTSAVVGGTAAVTATVQNQGATSTVAGPFDVAVYLTAVGDPGTGVSVGTAHVTRLAGGASLPVSVTATVPSSATPGAYRLRAVADTGGLLPDSATPASTAFAPITLVSGQVDLAVSAASVPATAAAGGALPVTYTVRNLAAPVVVASQVRLSFYLSVSDPTPGAGVLLGTRDVGALAGGASLSGTNSVTVPATTAEGTYPVSVVASLASGGADANNADNGRTAGSVTIRRPDLAVGLVTVPATAGSGGSLPITHRVENRGPAGANAGAFTVGFYLSPSDPTPGAGTLVGTRALTGLAGAATSTLTTPVTVPAATPAGQYYVSVVADIADTVPERDEGNNGRTAAAQIVVSVPDLALTSLVVPATAGAGANMSVTSTVQNVGPVNTVAGPLQVGIYMSATDPTPGAGTLVGLRTITSLAGGALSTVTTPVTVPVSLPEGNYSVSAVADIANAVPDPNRSNNGRAATTQVSVRRPDLVVTSVTAPTVAGAGGSMAVGYVVANSAPASAAAGPFRIGVYVSSGDPTPGAGTLVGFRDVTGLAGGATTTGTILSPIPATAAAGNYSVSVVADITSAVPESNETNNGRTAPNQVSIVRPDLVMTAVSGPATAAAGASIVVLNTVRNQGPAATSVGPFRVGIYLSSSNVSGTGTLIATRDLTDLSLRVSTAATTAVVPAGTAPGPYFLSAVADLLQVVPELDETNNGLTSSTPIMVTQPDLTVTSVRAPAAGAAGGTLGVSYTVRDLGGPGGTLPSFRVGIYLSPPASPPGSGTLLGFQDVTTLLAGANISPATVVSVPADTADGTYVVTVLADINNAITESNETNNGANASTPTVIARPDLVMTALTAPASAPAGHAIVVPNTVANQGVAGSLAGPFRVTFYISATDQTPGAGVAIGSRDVAALAGGANSSAATTLTIPAGTAPALYYLSAVADSEHVVAETNEANNGLTAHPPLSIAVPDLVMSTVSGPSAGGAGGTISVSSTVTNQGAAGAVSTFRVGFYLSTSITPGTGVLVGSRDVAGLAAGAASTATTSLTIPGNASAGTYFLSAVADILQAVPEADRTNNGLTAPASLAIALPDLVVTAVTGPVVGGAGGTIAMSSTVANTGGAGTVAAPSRVAFYLSTSVTPGTGTLLGFRSVPALAAGAASTATAPVTIPANTSANTYFLSAVADADNVVVESNETNNGTLAPASINVLATDVVLSAVAAPPIGGAGGAISVSSTVGNAGAAGTVTAPFRISFYLARDDAPSVGTPGVGQFIGFRPVVGLPGQTNSSAITTLTIPGNTSVGTYVLSAIADVEHVVTETNLANNGFTAAGTLTIGTNDLTMTGVSGPLGGGAGGTIAVLTTVGNRGPVGTLASLFRIGVYLSANDSTPGAGVLIGTRLVTALAGGTNSSATTTVTIPGNTSAGTYWLSVKADIDDVIPESDETNNGRTAANRITITVPDLATTSVTPPATGGAGGPILVASTITNNGPPETVAGPFFVGVYLSPTDNTPGAGILIGRSTVVSLAGGASVSPTTQAVVPANTSAGTYYVSVVADTDGTVPDPNRSDNARTASAQITISLSDLVITDVTAPATGGVGGTIQIPFTVTNQGVAGSVAGPFLVSFFISATDATPGAGRLLAPLLVNPAGGLMGGQSFTRTATLIGIPPSVAPGTYYLSAVADCGGAPCAGTGVIPESDETNNGLTAATQITLFPPDLVTTVVSGPDTAAPGDAIDVSTTVQNTAANTEADGFRVGIYLSTDPMSPGSGTFLGFRSINTLKGGNASQGTTTVTIPPAMAPGTYYLTAVVDDQAHVTEADETNNGLASATPITLTGP